MPQFRKKPVVIEAVQFDGSILENSSLRQLVAGRVHANADGTLTVPTLEGDMIASVGDWIIQGVAGELYPCKPDIFAQLYDPV